eukprot:365603-Chlamydomonas_euryale.AAC.8
MDGRMRLQGDRTPSSVVRLHAALVKRTRQVAHRCVEHHTLAPQYHAERKHPTAAASVADCMSQHMLCRVRCHAVVSD